MLLKSISYLGSCYTRIYMRCQQNVQKTWACYLTLCQSRTELLFIACFSYPSRFTRIVFEQYLPTKFSALAFMNRIVCAEITANHRAIILMQIVPRAIVMSQG